MRALGSTALILLLGACAYEHGIRVSGGDGYTDAGLDLPDLPSRCPGESHIVPLGEPVPEHYMDILVVVDNSMSMAEEQASLTSSFPYIITSLLDPDIDPGTGLPFHHPIKDLHIGVVSTDMGTGGYRVETCSDPIKGDDGVLLHAPNPSVPGCDGTYPTFQSYDPDETDEENITRLAKGFECTATLGTDGCGWEQPLKAATRALIHHRDGANAGFLRHDSLLLILFLTDEEDCSVAHGNEGIFDTLDSSLGHLNLRCFHHPYMIEAFETYISAFESIRPDPSRLFLAFLVGVPVSLQCEGLGSEIPSCLDHPDMIEEVDPVSLTRLVPSCVTSTGEAYPPRRLVSIAQHFGDRALVRSICTSDLMPAIRDLTTRIEEGMTRIARPVEPLPASSDISDPCRCISTCRLVEALADLERCHTVDKPCYEPDGPGTGCADPLVDPDGLQHTLCEIPQAGTRMSPCASPLSPSCSDTSVTHFIDGEGWLYMEEGWSGSSTTFTEPTILFTEDMEPEVGSHVYLVCCP